MTTTVLFLCKDLFFWPVVKDAVASFQANLLIVRRPDDPKLNDLQPGSVTCCLIDLASLEVSQIAETIQGLRQKVGDQVRFVAFGPHVQESRLLAAEQAGCSPVLSRGQFQARLPSYLSEWLA